MTQPKTTEARLVALEAAMTTLAALEQRVGRIEAWSTGTQTMLGTKIPEFEKVGARVTELSAAYLAANERLTKAETDILAMGEAAPPPAEQRILAVEEAVSKMVNRVGALEATRSRTGLSSRLSGIEHALALLLENQLPGNGGNK